MTVFHFLAAAAILMAGLACAFLPFIAVWDRRLAVARRRSLYDKSAGQTESLTAFLTVVFAASMGGDLLMAGCIDRMMAGPWRMLWEGMVMLSAFSALSAVVVLYAAKGVRNAFSVLCGLASAAAASFCVVLVWAFLFGVLKGGTAEVAVHDFMVAFESMKSADFIVFVLFCVCLAAAAAYGFALIWHILLRSRDDFGRDFYAFTLGMRARQASHAVLFLMMVGAVQYSMYPQMSQEWAIARLPFMGSYAETALTSGLLCLPASFALWYSMSLSSVPMQKRSYAFLGLLLLAAGTYCLLVRI